MHTYSDDIATWTDSLEDFKPEYTAVKVWTPIQCYSFIGKRTVILLDNFEPINDLHYALYSPQEKRYYLKEFPNVALWLMVFYKTEEAWDSYDAFLNDFRRRVSDGNVYLLLTEQQVKDTTAMLERLYKAQFKEEGKLPYKIYIELLDVSLKYEDYKDHGKSITGFKTVCSQFEDKINALWGKAKEFNKKK